MRTITLLRHAKSSWNQPGAADFARPLSPRGRRACSAVKAVLRRRKTAPDVVLASSAVRTAETLRRIAPQLPAEPAVMLEKRLYLASAAKLLARLKALDDAFQSVLLIGHNPGLQRLALLLAGRGREADLARLAAKFPTAGLVELHFPGKRWSELASASAELVFLWSPRDEESD